MLYFNYKKKKGGAKRLNKAIVADWTLDYYATGWKETISHLDFHCEVATVAMKVGLDVFIKRKGGPTALISMDISS